ncbi:hypothetical protein FSP39_002479 [Pinctada imbricata]|uniref:BTB domain-containing protein n=1 Tax=Pinctada imbricata TaxID=66713 RepID=A0AA88XY99_PINIB|nr:hypothetical protein FSP39_002479 [Pinctada imbricata]
MFTNRMMERDQTSIEIHEISSTTFQSVLEFLYTGAIDISEGNCQDVLAAANMLGISDLVSICSKFLKLQLDAENCLGIYRFADAYSCEKLKADAEKFINKNFPKVSYQEEFLELPQELVSEILLSENLFIKSEQEVFQAAMNWLLFDPAIRRREIYKILTPVRFPLVAESDIKKFLETCPDIGIKVALLKYIEDFKQERSICKEHNLDRIKPHLTQPRRFARKNIYLIGGYFVETGGRWNDIHTLEIVSKYDTFNETWVQMQSLIYPRHHFGICVHKGLIYVAGGEHDSMIYDAVERYNPQSNKWYHMANLNHPRSGLGLVAVTDKLYALGGWIGMELGNTVEEYDPVRNEWRLHAEMPTLRIDMAVVELEGLIYVIGGADRDGGFESEMSLVESFNPVTKEWEELTSMNESRAYPGVASLGGYIYAVGGYSSVLGDLATVEKYCPMKNMWTSLPPMSYSRTAPSVVGVNGLLYIMGGRHSSSMDGIFSSSCIALDSMECYDPKTNTWTLLPRLPTPTSDAGAVFL